MNFQIASHTSKVGKYWIEVSAKNGLRTGWLEKCWILLLEWRLDIIIVVLYLELKNNRFLLWWVTERCCKVLKMYKLLNEIMTLLILWISSNNAYVCTFCNFQTILVLLNILANIFCLNFSNRKVDCFYGTKVNEVPYSFSSD